MKINPYFRLDFHFKPILIAFLGIMISTNVFGQCSEIARSIKIAERYFEGGNLKSAAKELATGLKNTNAKDCPANYFKAELLLTEVSLFMNQDSLADKSFRQALKIRPLYKVDTNLKSIDLFYFSKKYHTVPLFSLRPYASINNFGIAGIEYVLQPDTSESYSTGNNSDNLNKRLPVNSYSYGIYLGWHPLDLLEIGIGGTFGTRITNINKGTDVKRLLLDEKQSWITVPILAKINIGNQRHIGKIILGVEYGYLRQAMLKEASNSNILTKNREININNLRHKHHYFYTVGLGYDVRPTKYVQHYISLELRYANQRTVLVKNDTRFSNPETLFGLGYVDDDVPIGTGYVEFSVGISLTRYRVQKTRRR